MKMEKKFNINLKLISDVPKTRYCIYIINNYLHACRFR